MTQTHPSTTTVSAPAPIRPDWWSFAAQSIRRMQKAATSPSLQTLDDLTEDFAFETSTQKASAETFATPLELLNAGYHVQHLPDALRDAIAQAGDDPAATDEHGRNQPAVRLPTRKLLLLIRLAASFVSASALAARLKDGAITVIEGVPEGDLDLLQDALRHLLPQGWSLGTNARAQAKANYLCSIALQGLEGSAMTHGLNANIASVIDLAMPILIALPPMATRPPMLTPDTTHTLQLAPITPDVLIALMRATHSATGRIDELAVRAALPEEAHLAKADPTRIALALRAPTARKVAERLANTASAEVKPISDAPKLDDFTGNGPALRAAHQLARDLRDWRAGEISWHALSRSLILYGPPGTGKTWLAQAIGNSAGFTVVTGSFGEWQSRGHLGDMLSAMRAAFAEARSNTPAVLIIDEIDSVGSREAPERHNQLYHRQVINTFLAEMDTIAREEGVIVIGTCNHLHQIDPAVLRAGRFDLKIELPLPRAEALLGVLKRHLQDWPEAHLRGLATLSVGLSAADVDATIRQCRTNARGAKRALTLQDLQDALKPQDDPSLDWRVALHECGHAIAIKALSLGTVQRIALHRAGGGLVDWHQTRAQILLRDHMAALTQTMAGRAAEQLILGEVSSGSGGGDQTDLAKATELAIALHTQLGLGDFGPVWLGETRAAQLLSTPVYARIRAHIEEAEAQALSILSANRALLEPMAKALLETRDMDEVEANHWLAKVEMVAIP